MSFMGIDIKKTLFKIGVCVYGKFRSISLGFGECLAFIIFFAVVKNQCNWSKKSRAKQPLEIIAQADKLRLNKF